MQNVLALRAKCSVSREQVHSPRAGTAGCLRAEIEALHTATRAQGLGWAREEASLQKGSVMLPGKHTHQNPSFLKAAFCH